MDMSGEYRIAARRETVWQALNDPEILRQCIPGCEELEKVSDAEFTAKARVKVGPVNAKFTGKVHLSDLEPPAGYTITGEGQGGAAGFGKGGAQVRLAEDGPDATLLSYTAHAQVGGKLAQIGSRLVEGTAKKMADDFFARFQRIVGGEDATVEAGIAPGVVETGPDTTDPMLHTTDKAADGITVPPAPAAPAPTPPAPTPSAEAPEVAAAPASPAATVPGDMVMPSSPAATAGNAPPGQPQRMPSVPGRTAPETVPEAAMERPGGIGPLVWIPVLVLVLALVLWAVL